MPVNSNALRKLCELEAKITASQSCSRPSQLFSPIGASPYSLPENHTSAPHSAPEVRRRLVPRDDFGSSRGNGSEHYRVFASKSDSLYRRRGGGYRGEEDSGKSEDDDEDDDFRVLSSFVRNRVKTEVRDKIEVETEDDESEHPLVRETCRLISLRAAWSPDQESELKRLLRHLKPGQVCAVLRAQPDERVALEFFLWAHRQWRYRHDPLVYHVMLKVLSRTKLCQGAKRVLCLMIRRRIELRPEDFGCVMVSFSRAGHLRKSMQVLTLMQKAGVGLDISVCNTAVNVLVEGDKLHKALRFMERMKAVGIEPNVVTYNCLIKGYCERSQLDCAVKLLDEMPMTGCCSPDKVSYVTIMGFLCKHKKIDELRGILQKMQQGVSKLPPDQDTYNTLVHMLCKNGHAEEALGFLREAERKGFHIDKSGHTAIVNCFCHEGKMDKAKVIVDEMLLKGCNPDVVTYTAVLDGFCRLGEIERAKNLLKQMNKHNCRPNCVSYTALLNGLCRKGNSSEAREMMDMSVGCGWRPNAVTYSVIMHGFRRERKYSEACDTVNEMIGKGFYPSPVEINLLIKSLCQAGQTEQAKKFMEGCLKKGCAVNVVNFTTVIHGLCKRGDLDSALSVFDDLYLNNKHPDEVAYNVVIDALGKEGRIDEAVQMTQKMLHCGLLPTQFTYKSIIHNFCKHKKVDDLSSLIKKMLRREKCETAYNQVIEKLCSLGYGDEAYRLLGRVLRTDCRTNVDTCHVLMRSLLKNGDSIGSYRVACRMFKQNLVPNLKLCEEVSKKLISVKKFVESDKLMLLFVENGHVSPKVKEAAIFVCRMQPTERERKKERTEKEITENERTDAESFIAVIE
ncbi:pentatricopeptide repeat-containing protein [Striga asiatica]|uniref:Pentatricopeptide repeat-containing protein n=1 Tax=Striga asiatica TaxID=4170 RepID=A0A5A7PV68_STRAF|nr:pentatricopeptide repeat-containing protein [Striga asiatica]